MLYRVCHFYYCAAELITAGRKEGYKMAVESRRRVAGTFKCIAFK